MNLLRRLLPLVLTKRLLLRLAIALLFAFQIFITVGLVGYLSYQSGQQAVTELAGHLIQEQAIQEQVIQEQGNRMIQNHPTALLYGLALLGSIGLGLWTTQKIVKLSLQLSGADYQQELERQVAQQTQTLGESEAQLHLIADSISDYDRKQAEAALQQSEERFREIAQTISQLFFVRSATTGEFIYVSPAYEQIWGRSCESLYQDPQSWLEAIHPDDRALVTQSLAQQFSGDSVQREYRIIRPDGEIRWIFAQIYLVQNENGELLRFIGSAVDISDRKQTEAALQASEDRLQTLVKNMPGMIYRYFPNKDGVGVFTYVSSGAYDLLELECEQILQDANSVWSLIHSEDLPSLQASVAIAVQNCTDWHWEGRLTTPSGQLKWIQGKSRPQHTPDGVVWDGLLFDITDRKRAELALQESEIRYRLLCEVSPVAIFRFGLPLNCVYVNDRWSEMTGRPKESALGRGWTEALHPDERDYLLSQWAELYPPVNPGNTILRTGEGRHLRPDGSINWYYVQVAQEVDSTGMVVGYIGTLTDITSHKQAEMALQQLNEELEQRVQQRTQELSQSEERLRLALMAANQGLYDLNIRTGEVIISPEYATMLGYDPATFQQTYAQWIEQLHPDDRERVAAIYRAYVAEEIPDYQVEFRLRTQDGHWKWILSLGKIVAWDEAGQPLRLLGTHTDIGARKQAEQALQESRNMLKLVLDTIPQRVFWKDRQSRFLGCNPAFASDYQLTPEEIIGKTDLELPWAEWAHLYRDDDARVINSRIPRLNYEEPTNNLNGEQIWIRTSKIPLTNRHGEVIGILGCYEDITDRKQAEAVLRQANTELEFRVEARTAELRQAKETAEAANRAKSTFLANMSHELRTPLNAILGFSEILFQDAALDSHHREQLSIINCSGEHLLTLINDVLEMSKIEAGQVTFTPDAFDLHKFLEELENMFRLRATDRGLQLCFERAIAVPHYIETDGNKLRQVLINLLGNAIKFTDQGSVILRVSIEDGMQTVASDISLRFEVEDMGSGIDSSEIETLFDPFVQSKHRQKFQEGTGLGLSISREFVRLLGGELTVTSQLGLGSIFQFAIPVRLVEATTAPASQPARRPIALAPGQPTYRILIVEDNWVNHRLILNLLEPFGFEIYTAADGEEAVSAWERWHPHLIWMDIRMPGIDGYEATRRIRAKEQERQRNVNSVESPLPLTSPAHFSHVIIIALTANAFKDNQARALAVGCDDFVTKPIQATLILEKMAEHLGLHYVYQELDLRETLLINPALLSPEELHSALQSMPDEWLTQLRHATTELNNHKVLQLIEQIPEEQASLAQMLRQKVNTFDFEHILELIQSTNPLQ